MPRQAAVVREESDEKSAGEVAVRKSQPRLKATALHLPSSQPEGGKGSGLEAPFSVPEFPSYHLKWNRIKANVLDLFTLILLPFIELVDF